MNKTLIEEQTFKDYFNTLNETGKVFKDKVKEECEISEATFYRYLSNPDLMPKLVKEKIQQIAPGVNISFTNS